MSPKPTLYIVPGASQLSTTAWSFFASLAKEAGYPVIINQLPTVGSTNTPLPALPDDVALIQNDLHKLINEEEKEVVLIGHSSGDLVASCATEGFDAGDRTCLHEQLAIEALLNDLPTEEQEYWGKQVTHTSMGLFGSPPTFEHWSNGVKCSYIFCERDLAVLMSEQRLMRERLGPDAKEVYLNAGHCPYLSMPRELLKAVEELLA
ncbi:hypothetical protein B0T20DRAFT_463777 [Sordaria brevicollis]|uniref:AB hydrolase-1 domain-containing protein n=1 Tax=Sordaria brevicollis TaxID=83679 RepID=A0AAE0P3B2_SORBR|nr:hypothetical protein B0T20DRAFT_463777 [Sordaria brevicollis]